MWAIFRRDLKRIFTNPVAIIVTLGIAILPSAYAWLNIIANWNPYENTQNISVAVANLDAGGSSDLTGDLNIGDQLVRRLKQNHRLGWKFVSTREAAIDGVSSGEYYASIVIDKNFSQQLIDMVTDGGEQPQLHYFVNEKLNPVAPKITDSGATILDRMINSAFVGTVAKTISDKMNISTDKAQEIIQGAYSQAITKVDDASDTLATMKDKVSSARESLQSTEKTITEVRGSINSIKQSVSSAQHAADQAAQAASSTSSAVGTFNNSAAQTLSDSAASLSILGIQAAQAGTSMSSALSTVNGDISTVSGNVSSILAQNSSALSQLQTLLNSSSLDHNSDAYKQLSSIVTQLQNTTNAQTDALNTFTSHTQSSLTAANNAISGMSGSLGSAAISGSNALSSSSSALNGSLGQSVTGTLDSAASLARATSVSLGQLNSSLSQAQTILDELAGVLHTAYDTMGTTEDALNDLMKQLTTVRTDMAALDSSRLVEALRGTNINAEALGNFMQSPIELTQKTVFPVDNYGSAIAPFFTNVALWVGGFVLIAVVKIEVDRKNMRGVHENRRIRNRDAYMGRWLLFVTIGIAQAIIATVGDLIIGIQMRNAPAFIFAGIFASIVFVSFIYALAATFKHIGKALAVIIVVMQVPGSSGTYPIEIMPPFFQHLNPWLPFTYSINAMRETIGGFYDGHYWQNLGVLSLFLVFSFVLGLLVRPYLLNLNALFDRRLADTDLLIGEEPQEKHARFRLTSVLQSMMSREQFGQSIRRRAMHFAAIYPRLVGWGIGAIIIIPILFLVLLFTVESKLVFLMLWLISVVLLDFYLIGLEYIREVYERELGMSVLSDEALRAQVLDHVARRWKKLENTGEKPGEKTDEKPSEEPSERSATNESSGADTMNDHNENEKEA